MRRKVVVIAIFAGILLAVWSLWPWRSYRIRSLEPVGEGQALLVTQARKSVVHEIVPGHKQTWFTLVTHNGQTLWHRSMGTDWNFIRAIVRAPIRPSYAVDAQRLYLQGHQDGRSMIQTLSRESGETLWRYDLSPSSTNPDEGSALVQVAGARLYVLYSHSREPDDRYTLHALSTQDGKLLWQQTLTLQKLSRVDLQPLSEQLLMIPSDQGALLFDGETGQELPKADPPLPLMVQRSMGWVSCANDGQLMLWRAEGLQLKATPLGPQPMGCHHAGPVGLPWAYKGQLIYHEGQPQADVHGITAFQPETQQRLWHFDLRLLIAGSAPYLMQLEQGPSFARWVPLSRTQQVGAEQWREELLVLDLDRGEVAQRYAIDLSVEARGNFKLLMGTERSYLLRTSFLKTDPLPTKLTELVPINPQSGAAQSSLTFKGAEGFYARLPEYTQDLWWFFDTSGWGSDIDWAPFEALRWGVFDLQRGEPAYLNGGYAPQRSEQRPDWLKEIP